MSNTIAPGSQTGAPKTELRYRIADAINDRLKSVPFLHAVLKKGAQQLRRNGSMPPGARPESTPPPPPQKPRVGIEDLDTLLAEIKKKLEDPDIEHQQVGLSEVYLKVDASPLNALDPFSRAYRDQALVIYKKVSRKANYDPVQTEKTDAADNCDLAACPIPYRFENSRVVGEFLGCYGWILRHLDVRPGANILEYGPGEGQLSIHLARMGCNVYGIDIEQRFLNAIQRQCEALGVKITTRMGYFGEGFDGQQFDRVLFFEAFHHSFDHFNLLLRIRELLKDDGFICFSGEPIIPADSPDGMILPYPWGLRLDGDAVRSTAEFGWMELGYQEPYFVELLTRCGYAVERHRCPMGARGDVYLGRKFTSRYPLDRDTLLMTYKNQSGWHATEGTHRWTDGDAWFPLPATGYGTARLTVVNSGPQATDVTLSCSSDKQQLHLESGAEAQISVKIRPEGGNLRIQSGTFIPSAIHPGSTDTRKLGVMVRAIEFS